MVNVIPFLVLYCLKLTIVLVKMTDQTDKPRMKTIDDIADEIDEMMREHFSGDFDDMEVDTLVMFLPSIIEFLQENYRHFLGRNKKHLAMHTCKRILHRMDLDKSVEEVMIKTISVSIDSLVYAYKNRVFLQKKTSKMFRFCCKE